MDGMTELCQRWRYEGKDHSAGMDGEQLKNKGNQRSAERHIIGLVGTDNFRSWSYVRFNTADMAGASCWLRVARCPHDYE